MALLTVLVWVPWRVAVPLADRWVGFQAYAGFPLDWVADAVWEPLYAGAMLALFAGSGSRSAGEALLCGVRLLPRLLLINFKVAVWGLAAPYLVLHIGSALFLTWWPSQLLADGIIAATLLSSVWMLIVLLRYLTAPAVLVAEQLAVGEPSPQKGRLCRFGSEAVSTGWALWAARKLSARRTVQAVLVILVGQGAVSLVLAFVPSAHGVPMQIVNGVAMFVTAYWWSLLWEFTAYCVEEYAVRPERAGSPSE